jgi:hypothetical protein
MNPQNSRKLPPFLPKMNIFEKFNKNDQNNMLYQNEDLIKCNKMVQIISSYLK